MFQGNHKDTRITLTEVVPVFLLAGLLSEGITQKDFEKQLHLNVRGFSSDYKAQFLHSKAAVCSV